ncbi:class I SAM-dependent methyltransferase [Sphingomonas quercus]|uniref:Class I SAM-dependent methyltransferase n=1 Tax=Sphingomonas quercus TaxID=2842451 RepID=A0ABS6BEF0_9SPHN|nr:class I SAM-dependent methyltransferase [Sphingomonas quercus]MBU3076695.1 class I SAM-dependent methyltransferase [Sphingomonas quercus]
MQAPPNLAERQAELDALHWWHSFDFGGGLAAKGVKTPAVVTAEADAYFAPLSLAGRDVLDIGTWNGYMAFDAERRGAARVVATDHHVWSLDWTHGRRPFDLAHRLLGSRVEGRQIDVPLITPDSVGRFDVVLFLGVFYHLFDAPTLTRQIAGCARDLMIVETHHDALDVTRPAMIFYPADTLNQDATNWWGPNPHCMWWLLRECGFGRVFYRDHPHNGDPAGANFRQRGIYFAFRDDAAVARLATRTDDWHDLGEASARAAIFSQPGQPPASPPSPRRRWWR